MHWVSQLFNDLLDSEKLVGLAVLHASARPGQAAWRVGVSRSPHVCAVLFKVELQIFRTATVLLLCSFGLTFALGGKKNPDGSSMVASFAMHARHSLDAKEQAPVLLAPKYSLVFLS